ncbi:MAG: spermidine/putrescine ABC transporter substrate-binding protein [Desulforhopalus sp.]|nr:spermidine/putrescine ABC transporter substrate-binding protein [Desulforhopalus sp.]
MAFNVEQRTSDEYDTFMKGTALLQLRRSATAKRGHLPACRGLLLSITLAVLSCCLPGQALCSASASQAAKQLVFYTYAASMPQGVLDGFTREYGIPVQYLSFQSSEEAEERIRSGQVYDVVLIENQLFPSLIKDRLLAEINLASVPNFKNISANFRDLVYDPGNRYSVPGSYGTTGLVVRTDLVGDHIQGWADLWHLQPPSKIGLRVQPREILGMTLTSLGFPFASENPRELAAALQRLLQLKPSVVMLDIEAAEAAAKLLRGEIAVLHGYAGDYWAAHRENPAVTFVLPREGTALWGESYAIPARSLQKQSAELFINYLLRPEVTAQIINEKKYAQPNDSALPLVHPEIRNNPVVFPGNKELGHGSIVLPLSPEGKKLYADIWAQFMTE